MRAGRYQREYFEQTLGHPAPIDGPADKIIDAMVESGALVRGQPRRPDRHHREADEVSGGFGGFMVQATEWGTREQVLHSYELLARYVMPRFQGSLANLETSQRESAGRKEALLELRDQALARAQRDYAKTR